MGSSKRSKPGPARTIQLTAEHEHDFWTLVDRRGAGKEGCWEWLGPRDKDEYAVFRFDGENVPAIRIMWTICHSLSLPSFQQVNRSCGNRNCVNPKHSRRANTKYDKWAKSNGKQSYSLLRPPPSGETDLPRKETIDALAGSHEELQHLRHTLRVLTGAIPTQHRLIEEHIKNSTTYLKEVKESLERLSLMVGNMVTSLADVVASVAKLGQTAPTESVDSSTPSPFGLEITLAADPETEAIRTLTSNAFAQALGINLEPNESDYRALETVFDLALHEEATTADAVALFGAWLASFGEAASNDPDLERTPQGFAHAVSARRLERVR